MCAKHYGTDAGRKGQASFLWLDYELIKLNSLSHGMFLFMTSVSCMYFQFFSVCHMLATWWMFNLAVHTLLFALIFISQDVNTSKSTVVSDSALLFSVPSTMESHMEKPQCLWRELKSDTMQKYKLEAWFIDEFSRDQNTIGVQAKQRSEVWRRYTEQKS